MNTGRIIKENKTNYILTDAGKEFSAVVRGKFHDDEKGFPKVGDYVEYVETAEGEAVIESILPRTSTIVRKAAGETTDVQVIVANVDLMLVVMGLDEDFNLNRLERYLLLAEQSDISAVIVLNKCDTVEKPEEYLALVQKRYPLATVILVSAAKGTNMSSLVSLFKRDTTVVLLGSSGAGKSTITNWLLNEAVQDTREVRADDGRGRHTTTARQLFALPSGGFLIDTPGMRELGLMGEVEGDVFADIEALGLTCKFSDCDHERSAGCAILQAVAEGTLSEEQRVSYLKLKREKAFLDSKGDADAKRRRHEEDRRLHKKYNQIKKGKFGKR